MFDFMVFISKDKLDSNCFSRHKVHPIAAVEAEMSLWSTDILHNDIAKTCAELQIPVIAYSPLGRGVLTGAVTSLADIPDGDIRHHMSRFQEENFKHNMKLINEVNDLAIRKGAAPAQIALAWIRTQSNKPDMPTIIPIPGGTTKDKVVQNMGGAQVLTDSEMAEIEAILEEHTVSGARY
jgi:pyridoxine 4-dehydrogenase